MVAEGAEGGGWGLGSLELLGMFFSIETPKRLNA